MIPILGMMLLLVIVLVISVSLASLVRSSGKLTFRKVWTRILIVSILINSLAAEAILTKLKMHLPATYLKDANESLIREINQ